MPGTPDIPRLAQAAHLAWSQVINDNSDGLVATPWDGLEEITKEAWAAAVQEVLSRT